ncbi:hypothetical protein LshimejAT787_1200290 [Lyophyllum shimeji]|uniref:Uncharacterized protein n=1 Tax=Lyophyllum shimeji TaxID=47721 RepID=A0A9P3USK5_LYOSH|nr:hypothetical protein LshimejAT787_1200290 [Lyophyllum shimeji]
MRRIGSSSRQNRADLEQAESAPGSEFYNVNLRTFRPVRDERKERYLIYNQFQQFFAPRPVDIMPFCDVPTAFHRLTAVATRLIARL